MGIYLSNRKIAQLQAITTVLLSPFAAENGDEWRRSVCDAIEPIFESRGAMFGLMLPDETPLIGKSDVVAAMLPSFPPTGWVRDGHVKALARGDTVVSWRDIYEPAMVKKSDFYNEVVGPNRVYAPLMLTVPTPESPLGATVFNYYESESRADGRAEERKQLLRLLAAPFKAAINAYVGVRRQRATLMSFGELANVSLALFDMNGHVIHHSRALERLLSLDPEAKRIRGETARMASNLSAVISARNQLAHLERPIKSRLITHRGSYGLSAISFGDGFGVGTVIGVMVEDLQPRVFDAERLVSEYHLTKRELQTAALLERRMSASEIASALGVSVNTARRHTEHVLAKLGVHSRKAAAQRMGGAGGGQRG